MQDMQDSIWSNEEKVPKIEVNYEDDRWEYPIHQGTMTKQGSFFPTWRKRHMILTLDGEMYYFKNDKHSQKSKQPRKKKPVLIRGMKFCSTDKKKNCIKIERFPKPFYFYAKDHNTMVKWMEQLEVAGGIKQEKEYKKTSKVPKDAPEISKKDMARWNQKNVAQWLQMNTFGKEPFSIYEQQFADNNITGKDLEKMTEKQLQTMGITNLPHRKKLIRAIKELRGIRKFNYTEFLVYNKIEKMTKNFGKCRNANWKFLAKSLSDPDCMQETYLNPSILHDSIAKQVPDQAENSKHYSDEEVELVEDNVEVINCDLKKQKPEKFRLPVKLVVTEMVHSEGYKTARKLLSPVLNKLPTLKKEFGIFHTAIIVGPWYLEWTDSSLVIPRKLYSSMALVSADIDATTLLKNTTIDQISEKLANVVTKWNTKMQYCNINMNNKPNHGNCQEFVEDVMETLSISLNKEGAFGKFLEKMKKSGQCEMVFSPSKEFKTQFHLQLNEFKFDTHEELDNFVHKCAEVDEIALQMDYKEEYKLLKSFDRAFWLRHFKKPNIERFKPTKNRKGCPFEDPRKTKSYMTYC